EVGLGSDNQSKLLQTCCDLHAGIAVTIANNFPQVHGTPFRGDRPQNVRQVFRAKSVGRREMMQAVVNGKPACMAGYLGIAGDLRREAGSAHVNLGCAATIPIVHSLRRTLDDSDAIGWSLRLR